MGNSPSRDREQWRRSMQLVEEAREQIPVKRLCDGLGFSRATYYREINPPKPSVLTGERPASPRALSPEEEEIVLAVLNSDRFCDRSPTEVYYTLLDEGIRYCSLRTMYRILSKNQEIQERRRQAQHPHYAPPNSLRRVRIRFGRGISPNWRAPAKESTINCMSSLTYLVDSLWDGWLRRRKRPCWQSISSKRHASAKGFKQGNSRFTRIAAPPCVPSRWRVCYRIWASPSPIAVHEFPTTIPFQKANSKH